MKTIFFRLQKRCSSNSGIILLVVLWVLMILTVLAVSLGRSTNIDLALTKHAVGKVKAKYLAWGGLIYAIDQIRRDSESETSATLDTLYFCAIPTDVGSPENLFIDQPLGEGSFNIEYKQQDNLYQGLQDQERWINLNGLRVQEANVISSLIVLMGFDEEIADTIAFSIIDWKDEDSTITNDPAGAEDDYYMSLASAYHCKNRPFDSKEELLLVRGMTEDIYEAIKDYITVFPKEAGSLRVNFDTAPKVVLQSIARSIMEATAADITDADSLADKLIDYRSGEDGQAFTIDDRQIDGNEIALNQNEQALFLQMGSMRTTKSDYLRVVVNAQEQYRNIETQLEAIINRNDLSVVYWNRK